MLDMSEFCVIMCVIVCVSMCGYRIIVLPCWDFQHKTMSLVLCDYYIFLRKSKHNLYQSKSNPNQRTNEVFKY